MLSALHKKEKRRIFSIKYQLLPTLGKKARAKNRSHSEHCRSRLVLQWQQRGWKLQISMLGPLDTEKYRWTESHRMVNRNYCIYETYANISLPCHSEIPLNCLLSVVSWQVELIGMPEWSRNTSCTEITKGKTPFGCAQGPLNLLSFVAAKTCVGLMKTKQKKNNPRFCVLGL